jgi:enoyl-CoA hydratase/carnithine racemase
MNQATVLQEIHDGVIVLTLNRPASRNAFKDKRRAPR